MLSRDLIYISMSNKQPGQQPLSFDAGITRHLRTIESASNNILRYRLDIIDGLYYGAFYAPPREMIAQGRYLMPFMPRYGARV